MENLRTSSYLIDVKLEDTNKYMLIHGYTGAIDIVNEKVVWSLKNHPEDFMKEDTPFSEETVEALKKRGYLTEKTREEEYAYVARMAKALYKRNRILYTDFTWVVTYNCNFRCPYCYEERKLKDAKYSIVFNKEMVDIAYHAQDLIQPRKELRRNIITLYGGEPLLIENKKIINYIVREGYKRGYKFVAVTNGYELDAFTDLLNPKEIFRLQITLDGTKEIHDKRRVHYKHHNTFDHIIANIQLALKRGVEVSVRMNTDSYNIDNFVELKEYLEQKDFFDYPNFSIYSAALNNNASIDPLDYNNLEFLSANSYVTKHKRYGTIPLCIDYGITQSVYKAISQKQPISFRAAFCSSQTAGYVLDPLGDIYPCWEVVGKKNYLVGKYTKKEIIWNDVNLEQWKFNVGQKKPCCHCRFALLCGGGCPYHSLLHTSTHCEFYREIFDVAVNQAYARVISDL